MTSSAATILREKGRAAALAEQVKSGNVRALSRLLTLLECEHPDGTEGLRLLTLEAQPRSVIGVTGYPGAGKSTLLKVIVGIIEASSGEVYRRGRVAALLELGAGFHPDLSGRENVYLNAALLGMSTADTDSVFDDM